MTLDQALAKAAAALDVGIEQARQSFEQSLIDHQAPRDQLEDLLDWMRTIGPTGGRRHLISFRRELLSKALSDRFLEQDP